MTKTRSIKKSEINPEWHILDATGVRLGKLATKAASLLIGKHKTNKADNMPSGDKVVIINSKLVDVHKRKLTGKKYYSHSGYIGGLKELDLEEMMKRFPNRVIEKAVKGMLPKNKLGAQMYRKLNVYAGPEHPHAAQKPEVLELNIR